VIIYTEGEKASNHKPKIECSESVGAGESFEVRVFNPIMLARCAFSEFVSPDVRLNLKLEKSGKIVALAYCNKHGLWSAEKEVKVE